MEINNNNLELQVKNFHEACRITSKYEDLKAILVELENSLKESPVVPEIQNIKEQFQYLIPIDKSDRSVKPIIRWCLARGYLQQAVTMTAEWFPRYALAAGVFQIVDAQVEEDNDQQRQPWDTWTGHLFKNYNPYSVKNNTSTDVELDVANMSVLEFRNLLKTLNYNYWDLYTTIKDQNQKKLENFLTDLIKVGPSLPILQFAAHVVGLPSTHPLKIICSKAYKNPDDANLEKYINRNLKKHSNPCEYILKILKSLSTETITELFGLPETNKPRKAKTDEETAQKIAARKEVFRKLLADGKIASSDNDLFLDVVEKQIAIIEFYRNRMNHGVINFEGIEGNQEIEAKVEELFQLAEQLEN